MAGNNETSPDKGAVERVARAIHAAHMIEKGPLQAWSWEEASKTFYDNLAAAAIATLTPSTPIPVASPGYEAERQSWFCELPAKVHREIVRQVREIQAFVIKYDDQQIETIAEAVWNGLCDSGVIPKPGYEAGLADARVSTGAECRMRIALEAIKDPPTKNGFRGLALWMQATAKEALL